MTPERWHQITAVFLGALDRHGSARDTYLERECAGDHALRSEVVRLLCADDNAGQFLQRPIEPMRLAPGTRLGKYEIIGLIGAGGMGEVYRARDSALGREVALKFLPSHLAADLKRQDLFAQEARAIAAINHPYIVTIHAVEKEDGYVFLAMELVEGQTLANLLPADGGLPLDQFFDIAIALVDAVGAAHEKGIVHRDLKPANVMIRGDGRVKVLDFGIATLTAAAPLMPVGDRRTTAVQTIAGRLIGTPSYMSPEQAQGLPADHRTDLFSLGVVLFEVITGGHPFPGDSDMAVLSAILTIAPPSITSLKPGTPAGLATIIERSLAKDPERRYQCAADLCKDLQNLRASLEVARTRRAMRRTTGWAAAALIATLAAIGGWLAMWSLRRTPGPPMAVSVRQLTSEAGIESQPDLSADAKWVAYAKAGDIWLLSVGASKALNLTTDEGRSAQDPAFSPDGLRIAYAVHDGGAIATGGIWLMDTAGGSKRRLSEFGFAPAWSPDGHEVVFTTEPSDPSGRFRRSRMIAIDVRTGATRQLIGNDGDAVYPAFSPKAKRIVYARMFNPDRPVIQSDIWTMPVGRGEAVRVTDDAFLDWSPIWSPDGRFIYFCSDRSGSWNVWRIAVDETTGDVLGKPEPVPTPARTGGVSLAADGQRFVYNASDTTANIYRAAFDPISETVVSEPAAVTSGTRQWNNVDVAKDGRLAFGSHARGQEIYVSDGDGARLSALEPDAASSRLARWSPDGAWIAFASLKSGDGNFEIFITRADGSQSRRLSFFGRSVAAFSPLWSPDGKQLAVTTGPAGGTRTYLIDIGEPWPGTLKAWLTPPEDHAANEYRPSSWSPDGRSIIAYSLRGAGLIVYSTATTTARRASATGVKPRWMSDSRRVIYVDAGKLFLLDVESGRSHELSWNSGRTDRGSRNQPR